MLQRNEQKLPQNAAWPARFRFLSDEHSSCAQCIIFKPTGQNSLGKLSNVPSVAAKDPQCLSENQLAGPRKNPRGLAFFRQCSLTWGSSEPHLTEKNVDCPRSGWWRSGTAEGEPDHDSNGALQTSGLEGASNELGVSETMSRSIRDRFLTKETEASETHTFYTKDKLNLPEKQSPLQPWRTYQHNAHNLPGPPLSSALLLLNLTGRCSILFLNQDK